MTAVVYTDASYDDILMVAACGFCIVVNNKLIKHEVHLLSDVSTSTHAEAIAITEGILVAFMMKDIKAIHVRTDCITLSDKYKRTRNKSWLKDFKETIKMCKENNITINITHIKGHKGDKYNSLVDRHCRKNLREIVSVRKLIKDNINET